MNEIDDPLEIDSRRERGLCPHPTHSGDCRLTGDICSHGDEPAAECPEFIRSQAQKPHGVTSLGGGAAPSFYVEGELK